VSEKIWLKCGNWDGLHGIRGVVSSLSLREDEGNIGGQKKGRCIRELLGQEKNIVVSI
jgi:hypothetical protein